MLTLSTGKERSLAEFDRLFAASGFERRRTIAIGDSTGVTIVEARGRT